MKSIRSLFCLFCLFISLTHVSAAESQENCRTLTADFKTFLKQYESEFSRYGVDPIFTEGQLSYRYSAVRAIFDAWIFVGADNQSHLLRLEGLEQYYGIPVGKIGFYDVVSKSVTYVSLTKDASEPYHYGTMTLGGSTIYVKVYAENINYPATQLTWGEGATYGEVGAQKDRFDCDPPSSQPVPPPVVTYDPAHPPVRDCRGMAKEVEPALVRYNAAFAWFPWYYNTPILVEGELSNAYTSARGSLDGWVIGRRLLQAAGLPTIINGLSVDKITFADAMTGETFEVAMQTQGFVSRTGYASSAPGSWLVAEKYHQGTFVLDGETVFVQVVYVSTTRYPAVQLTWGTGATYGLVGLKEDHFDCDPPVPAVVTPVKPPVTEHPSVIGGVGGSVIIPSPEPRPPSELPGVELNILQKNGVSYRQFDMPDGKFWGCFVLLTRPLPANVVVWWDSEWSGQYPVQTVLTNEAGTYIGFQLSRGVSHLSEARLQEIGRVRIFELRGNH